MPWIVCLILALIAIPAKASLVTESGQYEVTGTIAEPAVMVLSITGDLLTHELSQEASIGVSVSNGLGRDALSWTVGSCVLCSAPYYAYGNMLGILTVTDTSRLLDIGIAVGGDPNNLALDYFFQNDSGLTLVRVGSVPELSTWAMLIIGFVGVTGMQWRRRHDALER